MRVVFYDALCVWVKDIYKGARKLGLFLNP